MGQVRVGAGKEYKSNSGRWAGVNRVVGRG